MVSFTALRAARRAMPLVIRTTQQQQRRGFALGGHHGPPPEWEGIDKVVRGYFPKDYQLAIAILSGYAGLAILFKIKSAISGKPVEEAKPVAKVTKAPTTGVPALESPEFEKFVETDAFTKLLEDESQLTKLVESA